MNFISTDFELNAKSEIQEKFEVIVAKRVDVIDQYPGNLNIEKFDLVIDFGILYWITKPFLQLIISLNYSEIMG